MCGRYLFKLEQDAELDQWLAQIPTEEKKDLSLGEVFPTQKTLVFSTNHHAEVMRWGIPKWDQKGHVINARIETVAQSPFFKDHLQHRRILVRAEGFYEWGASKQKHYVHYRSQEPMYMAGLYTTDRHFAILTTEALGDFRNLHMRIPVFIPFKNTQHYLDQGLNFLNQIDLHHPALTWENVSSQISLF